MSDSDPICGDDDPKKLGDFYQIFNDVFGRIQFKFIGFAFIVFMILSTDTFINRILNVFSNAVAGGIPTSWGTTLQGLFLVLALLVIDPLIRLKVI